MAPIIEETKGLFDGISGTKEDIESKLDNAAKCLAPTMDETKGLFDGISGTKDEIESKLGNGRWRRV